MDKSQDLRQMIMDVLATKVLAAEGQGDDASPRAVQANGDLDLTSLELVRLLVSLEERLGIELDDAAIMNANLDTVDDIVALVSQPA